ncbi:MAG: hypothetical protein LBT96_00210 [Campylobacteraceae bacterium]|jgi:hypothetical protein|nr:hypothetical protein [Campylobacteraceae bacterium]
MPEAKQKYKVYPKGTAQLMFLAFFFTCSINKVAQKAFRLSENKKNIEDKSVVYLRQ